MALPHQSFLYLFGFIFGALWGSFLNVCIVRIPKKESIVHPRSHCPHCGRLVRAYDNIPILSFILLKGRCRDCRESISWQYPSVEFLTGLLAVACLWKFSPVSVAVLWFFTFICPLIVVSFIDLKHWIIPNVISLPFIPVGVLVRLGLAHFHSPGALLLDSFLGIVLGGGLLAFVGKIYEWIRKEEGIGMGDVKLAAMIGAFLGWKAILIVFVLSSFIGSVVGIFAMLFGGRGLRSQIPYGPFLSLGSLLQLFYGPSLLRAYFHFLHRLLR
ncbi:MAG: prepilin peptidase [bacterium]